MKLAIFGGEPAVTIQRDFRWPIVSEEDIAAVSDLLRAGMTSDPGYSEPVRRLEEEWARYLGVEFALSRVNGTAALHSALFAAGVGPGDEVIVQSYTWIATAGCVLAAGAVPVFADIDPATLTLDPVSVESRIGPRTRAIVVVHLWGHPAAMDELRAIANRHSLTLIEDAAHAHGGLYKSRKTGTLGDIGCFSFQASKAIPAGEGGILVTERREYFERALLLAQSPGRLAMHIEMPQHREAIETGFGGFKYRINPVNAVLALGQLKHFEARNAIRQRNLDFLTSRLTGLPGIRPPYTSPDVTRGGYYGYPIVFHPEELPGVPIRTFIAAMNAEGVPVIPERYPMLHLTPMFRKKNPLLRGWPWSYDDRNAPTECEPGNLPVTEKLYPRLMAIASHDKVIPCEDLFAQWADAFEKVTQEAHQLQWAAVA